MQLQTQHRTTSNQQPAINNNMSVLNFGFQDAILGLPTSSLPQSVNEDNSADPSTFSDNDEPPINAEHQRGATHQSINNAADPGLITGNDTSDLPASLEDELLSDKDILPREGTRQPSKTCRITSPKQSTPSVSLGSQDSSEESDEDIDIGDNNANERTPSPSPHNLRR
ncbi:hypothetical protein M422DRAFT_259354, partial [Sphaerobolus stellatus SS14]